MNLSIFKSYDIRGIYPKDLNKEAVFKIGQAFVKYTGAKNIVVGRDMRISSPELFESLVRGITSQGANVHNIGLIPTEGIYFSIVNYDYDAGIMITASHNPKEYNGLKLVQKKEDILEIVRGKDLIEVINDFKSVGRLGEVKDLNIWQDYINHIFSLVDVNKIKPLKVVIDAGNGMAGKVIPLIQERLPIEIIPLNFTLDGNFPAHFSNPLEKGVVDQISKEIKKQKADLGFIFDGDADRVFLVDEKGELIKGDITLLLLAKYLLKEYSGMAVVYNLICSRAVPKFIKKFGGKPIRTKVGAVNIMKSLLENNGIVGGELSGHFSFKENYYSDSGFIAFLILLQIISEYDQKVSEIVKEFSIYAKSPELNFEIEDKEGIIKKVKEKYSDGKQDYLDGVTVEYKDWWFNLRPSNTEPLLRLTIEADTKKLLKQKIKELSSLII